jgi:undecaprenyl-diphosphatase
MPRLFPARTNLKRLLNLDQLLSNKLRVAETPGLARNISILIGHTGDSWYWLAALGIIFLTLASFRLWALILIAAIFALAALIMAIKFSVRRQRPQGEWGQLYRRSDPHSFPSGHAARAVMLAVVIAGLGPSWLAPILLFWAPFVGLARVATGLHFVSDVIAGWAVGYAAGWAFLQIINTYLPQLLP